MRLAADIRSASVEALLDILDAIARLSPKTWVILVVGMALVNIFLVWGPSIHKAPIL